MCLFVARQLHLTRTMVLEKARALAEKKTAVAMVAAAASASSSETVSPFTTPTLTTTLKCTHEGARPVGFYWFSPRAQYSQLVL